ncbi:MAG: helix-turn-helix transcriptional regulator [Kribbellaceae bacterium]|nr:helix-turn-helix transcriptional regulator [Kribbellaceae bacterium]
MKSWSIYPTPSATERRLGLCCLGAGEKENGTEHMPERALGSHALVWVTVGSGHLQYGPDRELYEVRAPAMLRLHAGVLHSYVPATRWRQAWTLFGGPATEALAELGHLGSEPVSRYPDPRPIDRAFTRLLRVSRAHNAVQTAAALFDLIAQAAPQPADEIAGRLAELACTPMSIRSYADRLDLSVEQLREVIRRTTGSTPHELILTTRLSTAKVLLAEEDIPVAAVARRVGYDDPAYFTRLFSSRVGMSPIAFRRSGETKI